MQLFYRRCSNDAVRVYIIVSQTHLPDRLISDILSRKMIYCVRIYNISNYLNGLSHIVMYYLY